MYGLHNIINNIETISFRRIDAEATKYSDIEESNSSWNSPVIVTKMKSGKQKIVTNLRVVNKVTQPLCSLQSGILLPSLLPERWPLIPIDFNNCFFTITLLKKEKNCFHSAYLL